jgi:hypothetical protein
VHEPFPILKVVNQTTGETVVPKGVVFKASIAVKDKSDKVSVWMQCSQLALPLLVSGDNTVFLDAQGKGKAHVTYHYDAAPSAVRAGVKLTSPAKNGHFSEPPTFTIATKPAAERLWWQIATARDFGFVAPNFDAVIPATPTLKFDPFTETFFSPGRSYFLRVKACASGVWSEWSAPLEFRVDKPPQPSEPHFGAIPGGHVRLSWAGIADEFLVFGSNRADFVPEIFTREEVVAMEGTSVTNKRPNENLIEKVASTEIEFRPQYRFYRVIARKGRMFSVPGALWRLPDDLATALPPATVLQAHVMKKEGGAEVYRTAEVKLVGDPKPEGEKGNEEKDATKADGGKGNEAKPDGGKGSGAKPEEEKAGGAKPDGEKAGGAKAEKAGEKK